MEYRMKKKAEDYVQVDKILNIRKKTVYSFLSN